MKQMEHKIDTLHYDDLANRDHSSVFDENETYDMLIVRLPEIKEMHELDIVSYGFVITEETSYFFNPLSSALEELSERFDGPYRIIDRKVDKVLAEFQAYEDEILKLEESLYSEKRQNNFIGGWLNLKRDIVRIERVMLRTVTILNEMVSHYEKEEGFPVNHYLDLHEHCERLYRSATLQLAKLDYLYNFYNTRTNEKMNRLIFLLTIISAIFLPLNLLVGFFGMNTSGLPFTAAEEGTMKVVWFMGFVAVLTLLIVMLWRKKIEETEA